MIQIESPRIWIGAAIGGFAVAAIALLILIDDPETKQVLKEDQIAAIVFILFVLVFGAVGVVAGGILGSFFTSKKK